VNEIPPLLWLAVLVLVGATLLGWVASRRKPVTAPLFAAAPPPALGGDVRFSARDITNSNIINAARVDYHPQPARQTRFDLPARRADFVGRADLLRELERRLRHDEVVTVTSLKGIAGVGKSVLALEAAHRFGDLFPDGRYWLDLRGGDAEEVLRSFVLALGAGNDEQRRGNLGVLCALVRDALAGRQVLLVLDNADALARSAPATLHQMTLPPPARTLITSRVAIDPTRDLRVETLSDEDALALLTARGIDTAGQREDALALIRRLQGLALALDVTARRMAIPRPAQTCAGALAALDAAASLVDALRLPQADGAGDSVAASFALSYQLLDDELRAAYHALGVCAPSGVGVDEWAALLELATPAAHELALALSLLSLGDYDGARMELHPLLHDYARTRARADAAAWERLVVGHVAHFGGEIGGGYQRAVNDSEDYLPALQRADGERENILLAQERALAPEFPDPDLAGRVTDDLVLYWRRRYVDLNQLLGWLAVAERIAIQTGQPNREANVLQAQGDVLAFLDQRSEALSKYEEALGLFRAVGARLGEANVLKAQGDVLAFLDQRSEALSKYEEALGLFRAVGARLGEANVLKAQGDVLYFLKQTSEALSKYEEALGLFRAVGARLGEANVLQAQGDVALRAGEVEQGLELYERARRLYVQIGGRVGQANVGIALARHAAGQGDFAAAIRLMQPAADFGREIGHPLGDALQAEIDGWRAQMAASPPPGAPE
jgi:tetratricopeptide (TPR) repeat protein